MTTWITSLRIGLIHFLYDDFHDVVNRDEEWNCDDHNYGGCDNSITRVFIHGVEH